MNHLGDLKYLSRGRYISAISIIWHGITKSYISMYEALIMSTINNLRVAYVTETLTRARHRKEKHWNVAIPQNRPL